MKDRLCFGYGSLVNRDTHAFQDLIPAELIGWKRSWTHQSRSKHFAASSLNIEASKDTVIKGLISRVAPDQIQALDEREKGYALHPLSPDTLRAKHPENVHTYISKTTQTGDRDHPILQSYLDTVLSGFLTEFGEYGVHHFMETTSGWETPILRDRANPIYPRTTKLNGKTAAFFDDVLKTAKVNWLD